MLKNLLKRKPKGTQCGFCPALIFKHNEAGGEIHYRDGKPICARDRVMLGASAAAIKADKPKFEREMSEREKKEIEAERLRLEEVALASQLQAGGDSEKKTTLRDAQLLHRRGK